VRRRAGWLWLSLAALLAALAVLVPSAAARPEASDRPADAADVLPSWGRVCSIMRPVEKFKVLDLLGKLTDHGSLEALGMILTFTTPSLCPEKKEAETLLLAQNTLAQQLVNGNSIFNSLKSRLPLLVPRIAAQRPQPSPVAAARIVLPAATLTERPIPASSLTPVDVNWLQFGTQATRVDVKAQSFSSLFAPAPTRVISSGLNGLATTGFFGRRYVPLAVSAGTYWQLCIRASSLDPSQPYACGLRFKVTIDVGAANWLNTQLHDHGYGCAVFFGSQVAVAAAYRHATASFAVDGTLRTFPFRFDITNADRSMIYARSGLSYGRHTLCIYDEGPPGAGGAILSVTAFS
jgi:hypothetical protein